MSIGLQNHQMANSPFSTTTKRIFSEFLTSKVQNHDLCLLFQMSSGIKYGTYFRRLSVSNSKTTSLRFIVPKKMMHRI